MGIGNVSALKEASGIDYLTLTATGNGHRIDAWMLDCQKFVAMREREGNKMQAKGAHGYDGYLCGGAYVGWREDGGMFRASGPVAEAGWHSLFRPGLTRATRIDLQTTIWFSGEARNMINRAYAQAKRHRTERKTHRQKESFIAGGDNGDTAQIGSRSSEQFIRVYDKWRESGDDDYMYAIRYEVEYKGDKADMIAKRMSTMDYKETAEYVRNQVIGTMGAEGIEMPSDVLMGYYERVVPHNPPSDVETKLKWLSRQVKPTVEWLLERGYREQVKVALGLIKDHHSHSHSDTESPLDTENEIV